MKPAEYVCLAEAMAHELDVGRLFFRFLVARAADDVIACVARGFWVE